MLEFEITIKVGSFEMQACGSNNESRMGLFGPSGCGKTTLLNCLSGLLRPDNGYISLNGKILFDSKKKFHTPPHKRSIGYVFQDNRLFPHMSIRENVEYGHRRDSSSPKLSELVEVFGLNKFLDRSPDTLSGGEKQRVALARTLAASPRLLLLDEPISSIDTDGKLRILSYLNRAYEHWRIPYIYVSHSLSEMLFLTDKTWEMMHGKILHSVPPYQLLSGTKSEIDPIMNVLEGTVEKAVDETGYSLISCDGQKWKVPGKGFISKDRVTMAIPAGDLIVSLYPPHGISARNVLNARIQGLVKNGHTLWVLTKSGPNRLVAQITEDAGRELNLTSGKSIYLIFKSHSVKTVTLTERLNYE